MYNQICAPGKSTYSVIKTISHKVITISLAVLLVVSIGFNIVGLVFFIQYLHVKHNYKSMRSERNALLNNFQMSRGLNNFTSMLNSGEVDSVSFVSQFDGTPDEFTLLPPILGGGKKKEFTLVVYLHGMGSNAMEPFVYPVDGPFSKVVHTVDPSIILVSPSYRKEASFGNDAALSDINQNVHQVMHQFPITRVVVMGCSMGGCVAATYAVSAPADIKSLIVGVISAEGSGDLADFYRTCRIPSVKNGMVVALGGTPEQVPQNYAQKSLLPNIQNLSPSVRFAIISAENDGTVPPDQQSKLYKAIKDRGNPAKFITISGGHAVPPASAYLDSLGFVLSK